MHRTNGEDYKEIDGKRQFVAEDVAASQEATRLPAEDCNSYQEEICNVIELNGGTIKADAATDRAHGFRQLYDAIFASKFINTAALKDAAVTNGILASNSVNSDEVINGAIKRTKLNAQQFNAHYTAEDVDVTSSGAVNITLSETPTHTTYKLYIKVKLWADDSGTIPLNLSTFSVQDDTLTTVLADAGTFSFGEYVNNATYTEKSIVPLDLVIVPTGSQWLRIAWTGDAFNGAYTKATISVALEPFGSL